MDRGSPTEEVLTGMMQSEAPKGSLNKLESLLLSLPWQKVWDRLNVKLLKHDKELYVPACSTSRQAKERGMRQRRLNNTGIDSSSSVARS
jgi:hypothetical protein